MPYLATTALRKVKAMDKRIRVLQGGTSAGKTIALLLTLIDITQRRKNILVSVVSETVPHLKRGAIRDFLSIMKEHEYYKEERWNRTDFIYTFETGSRIEFFSADMPSKVRGPRRDILFINECNNISYETYTQLSIRTKETVFLDYNPVASFWIHEKVMPSIDHDFDILTYKDNEGLSDSIVKEIESRKNNKNFWRVYGEGLLGEVEGKIFTEWGILDEIPEEARLDRRGLDFGYSNDPTAIVEVYYWNGSYILDEVACRKGLSNKQIADMLNSNPDLLTVADSAEPKSIDEIKSYGVNIIPCEKGADSVLHGIQYVQDQKIFMTKRSLNLIKAYRNYMWMTDKEGKSLNKPDHLYSDMMDAVRYALASMRTRTTEEYLDIPDLSYNSLGEPVYT